MRLLRIAATISMLTMSACTVGKSYARLPLAFQPGGAQVVAMSQGASITGELVAVRDDGVILSAQRQLSFIPFASLGGLVVHQLGRNFQLSPRENPSRDKLGRLRSVSHFPQGLTPDIERQLLAQLGQNAIVTVR